jgi:hypothetical protein
MIPHMPGCDMIIKVFPAHPLFTKNKQPGVKDICVEFVPGTSGLCTDKGNDLINLIDKVPAMLRKDTAPGGNEQHTQ